MTTKAGHPIEITDVPDLARIAEEVRASNRSHLLMRDNEPVAEIVPLRAKHEKKARTPRRTGVLTRDDSFWSIVGIARSEGPGDVAENVDKYLTDAYMPRDA